MILFGEVKIGHPQEVYRWRNRKFDYDQQQDRRIGK